MHRCYQHDRRAPRGLNDRQVHELGLRIHRICPTLSVKQGEQIAQLCARRGVCYAARDSIAAMLGICRRTLDTVLRALHGLALFVVGSRGRDGGTVLIPLWQPLKPENVDAFLQGVMTGIRRVPPRCWRILVRAHAKICKILQTESPSHLQNPTASLESPTAAGESTDPPESKGLQEADSPLPAPPTAFQRQQAKLAEVGDGILALIRAARDRPVPAAG